MMLVGFSPRWQDKAYSYCLAEFCLNLLSKVLLNEEFNGEPIATLEYGLEGGLVGAG